MEVKEWKKINDANGNKETAGQQYLDKVDFQKDCNKRDQSNKRI